MRSLLSIVVEYDGGVAFVSRKESSAIHQTTTILADYNPKQDKTPDNLDRKQRAALKSLMKNRSISFFHQSSTLFHYILDERV